ncbi:TetR family transcriptional regulator [Kaistia sp. 32K]|uniref:TetR/AcrR family transcriptional regulator n=1 Tax=Kaistia sp. 32K TaxID=2795690 RepID=UPI0019152718|nr:TetR/AcrR family transcriptional regulator [Kaistia sp. 32K]BCP56350.1 TetR family transcriptional regulator [Kaistia sp. 32K]
MPKISDEAREARRLQILDAAWRCFDKEGLHATTMQDIIGVSGLSAGAVYSYFKSKDELIFAAVTTSLDRLSTLLGEAIREGRPASAPELAGLLFPLIARFAVRDGYDLRRIALLGWSEAQRNKRLGAVMRGYYAAFRDELGRLAAGWGLRSPTEADAVAKLLLSVLLGTVVQSAILEDVPGEEIALGLSLLAR